MSTIVYFTALYATTHPRLSSSIVYTYFFRLIFRFIVKIESIDVYIYMRIASGRLAAIGNIISVRVRATVTENNAAMCQTDEVSYI